MPGKIEASTLMGYTRASRRDFVAGRRGAGDRMSVRLAQGSLMDEQWKALLRNKPDLLQSYRSAAQNCISLKTC